MYGDERSVEQGLATMRRAGGSWADRDLDGAAWVEQLRSGRRLGALVRAEPATPAGRSPRGDRS